MKYDRIRHLELLEWSQDLEKQVKSFWDENKLVPGILYDRLKLRRKWARKFIN